MSPYIVASIAGTGAVVFFALASQVSRAAETLVFAVIYIGAFLLLSIGSGALLLHVFATYLGDLRDLVHGVVAASLVLAWTAFVLALRPLLDEGVEAAQASAARLRRVLHRVTGVDFASPYVSVASVWHQRKHKSANYRFRRLRLR